MLELATAVVKALGYAAALTAAGIVLARASLARAGGHTIPVPVGLARCAGAIVAILAAIMAFLFIARLGGEADAAAVDAVLRSPLGAALGLQVIGGLWLLIFAPRRMAPVGAVLILVAFGVVGHSASRGLVTSATVVLHVTAAAWWLGGLWILHHANRRMTVDAFAALVAAFSRQAIWMVTMLLIAALTTAALLLEFRFELELAYQRGLVAKLGLTLILLALAAANKLVLTPKLVTKAAARRRLTHMIRAELLLFATIFAVSGWLTAYASPHDKPHEGNAEQATPQITGPIAIIEPWAPAVPDGLGTASGYMVIVNNQPVGDQLIAARSPWAEHVSLHASMVENRMVLMREVEALRIPSNGRVNLKRGIYHLMFTGLYAPFVEGDTVPVTLTFQNAGDVEVAFSIRGSGGEALHEH